MAGLRASEQSSSEAFEKSIRPLLLDHCIKCHGPEKSSGGLRLDSREAMLKGGDSGPALVPGKPEDSLMIRVLGYVSDLKMPPKAKLPDPEIAKLSRWIKEGALWPKSPNTPTQKATRPAGGKFEITPEQKTWWAFAPLKKVPSPKIQGPKIENSDWPKNDIDRFILARMQNASLSPAPPANKRTLLRRVSFDLVGLPPTPEEMEQFLGDSSPNAFEKVVDRLLASPAYGQRWARHWLDVVRYADFHDGNPKARNPICEPMEAYRYRDWVVRSFNRDLPFDQFLIHQIAGDLLPIPKGEELYPDGLIATAFLVNGAWDRGDADKEKMVSDMVDDQIDTIGKAFLGMTLGCSRCHDHKFDPVSQSDYYALAGVFYSTRMLAELGAKGGEMTLQRRPLVPKAIVEKRAGMVKQIADLNAKLTELDKKTPKPAPEDPARKKLLTERDTLQKNLPPEPPVALAVSEGGVPGGLFPKIQDVPIHIRGSYTRLGPIIPRRIPEFLSGGTPAPIKEGSGRLDLAKWIASRDNPLTARVLVNRVWQWHFGSGLVRTPNNFGMLSEPPSHPELLDWLATQFIEDGWSIKKLHRRIVLSATYQQSSQVAGAVASRDPENRLLGRNTSRRLEAEAIRDAMVWAGGRLDPTPDGPATDDLNTPRRSLYLQTCRWDRSNFATLFDAANPDAAVEKRDTSTVAPQALFLLNHDFVKTQAKHLADRLFREQRTDSDARIRRLFELAYSRPPTPAEVSLARTLALPQSNQDPKAAWIDLAHVILCSNEFVHVD